MNGKGSKRRTENYRAIQDRWPDMRKESTMNTLKIELSYKGYAITIGERRKSGESVYTYKIKHIIQQDFLTPPVEGENAVDAITFAKRHVDKFVTGVHRKYNTN